MQLTDKQVIIINSFIGTTGLGFATILPILVGGIVDDLGYARSMIGWLSSANIIGIGIGGLLATLWIGKFSLLNIIRLGLVGLLIFDLLSIYVYQVEFMLAIRFISGIFGGLVYAGSLAAFSSLKNAIKAYGIYVIVYCLWGGVILMAMPILVKTFGVKSGFVLLAAMAILSLIGSLAIKNLTNAVSNVKMISLKELLSQKAVLISLLAYFTLQMGGGTIWAYTERIAKEAALSPEFTGYALALSSFMSFLGGSLVIRFGNKFGIRWPLIFGLFAMLISGFALFWSAIAAVYIAALGIFGGAWAFCIPYFQQVQSSFDTSGKVVSLGTIVNMIGRSTGPAIAALMLGSSPFVQTIWISAFAFIVSILLILLLKIK